ncbi:branched chain amino acid aminotransferase [Psittacicella hinzii]|uniref:Branched-chain-amino-acid aminotransferase n=1 Tax=Psittacicella hinzii TaxID=2028575 RepID=A0A3A1Y8P8_9GAMM|nr:branched-chain amino acid aminotransferase [Psittacicella hinzii]RIY33921.1 branched chain amino acid aminotransferase [Psittacicella hinzii]
MTNAKVRLELTSTPKTKVPEDKLGFGQVFTDHMFVMDWDEEKGWHDARVVPHGSLLLDPSFGALHYGQSIFEGLKAYNNGGKVYLFRPNKNFERLNNSADRMSLPRLDEEFALEALKEFVKVDRSWVPTTEGTSLYLRPLMFNSEVGLGVHPAKKVTYLVLASPSGAYFTGGLKPIRLYVEDEYVRAAVGGVGFAKTAGNYAASLKGQLKAEEFGCQQCLWLDAKEHRYVEEGGAMNVFFKVNGEFYTPALTGSILPGVTRDSMLQLLRDRGEKVHEARLDVNELFEQAKNGQLEEMFCVGTAAVVTPVGTLVRQNHQTGELEEAVINGGQTGKYTQDLYSELVNLQLGKTEDKHGWLVEVCDAE